MRLLITSDWHLDAVTLGVERRPELLAYVRSVASAARENDVDVAVFGGDAIDPGSMMQSQHEVDLICGFRAIARETTRQKIVAVAGNHDVIEIGRPLTTLSPVAAALEKTAFVAESPAVYTMHDHGADSESVTFLLLPYVARARFDAEKKQPATGPTAQMDQAFEIATELRKLGHRIVVVGHMTVAGAVIGSESVEMARGRDLDLPVDRIRALEPALVVNGHYHRPQIVDVGGLEIVIPGSPLSFTTDDAATGKGYVIAEV